jgi:hypothetical protein
MKFCCVTIHDGLLAATVVRKTAVMDDEVSDDTLAAVHEVVYRCNIW